MTKTHDNDRATELHFSQLTLFHLLYFPMKFCVIGSASVPQTTGLIEITSLFFPKRYNFYFLKN